MVIAMFALNVIVCDVIAYDLPCVLDSNLSLKIEVENIDDLDENWWANLLGKSAMEILVVTPVSLCVCVLCVCVYCVCVLLRKRILPGSSDSEKFHLYGFQHF